MSRQARILFLTHLYPLYILIDFRYNLGDVIFNVVPPLITCLLLYEIIKTNHIKLTHGEKRSIWLFISFKLFIAGYYEICLLAGQQGLFKWKKVHNGYTVIFIIFTLTFYLISLCKRKDHLI